MSVGAMQIQSDSMKILVFSDANFYKIVRAAQEPCHAPWWFKCQILKKIKMLVVSPNTGPIIYFAT